jgi:signal transduction histidine kinase
MIFTNLLSNAIKYYDAEQKDSFTLILIEQETQGVSIRIKDNGIGIATQHQERIFNMFFRASSKSTGSGLGLYIVREAIHKLGGTIAIEFRPGEGTEFILFLPNPG